MALVRDIFLELLRVIDPVTQTDASPFTVSNVGTVRGSIYPLEVQLDIYNKARLALYEKLRSQLTERQLVKVFAASIVRKVDFTFSYGAAQRPTGYIKTVSLNFNTGKIILVLPSDFQTVVHEGRNPHFKDSADNPIVFEISGYSAGQPDDDAPFILDESLLDDQPFGVNELIEENTGAAPYFYSLNGNKFIPNGNQYVLVYLGIRRYKLEDITNGQTVESFDTQLHHWIVEFGVRIANQLGNVDPSAVARG